MRYLGIDYGKAKVGLAISEGLIATPLRVVSVSSLEDAFQKIKAVVKKEGIDKVVIGMPESGESRKITKVFIERLCKEVEVIESEETLSSQRALDLMVEMGKGKKAREMEDAYSATLILQEYLDRLSETEND